ncbi:hypothetical protein BN903_5 [Halorubrum sp. AJ67]|nr:hypothetical protein BN903_5 [Halorubrum sp. AJ67]
MRTDGDRTRTKPVVRSVVFRFEKRRDSVEHVRTDRTRGYSVELSEEGTPDAEKSRVGPADWSPLTLRPSRRSVT